jgi:hypothetical protein
LVTDIFVYSLEVKLSFHENSNFGDEEFLKLLLNNIVELTMIFDKINFRI